MARYSSDWITGTGLDARRDAPTVGYDWLNSREIFGTNATGLERSAMEKARILNELGTGYNVGIQNPYSTPDYQPTIASSDVGFGTDFSDTIAADMYKDYATEARMAGDVYDDIFLTRFYDKQADLNKPQKKKGGGIWGTIGSIAGMVIGNTVAPGIGGQIGATIGGKVGSGIG